jgi:hypothetical protein
MYRTLQPPTVAVAAVFLLGALLAVPAAAQLPMVPQLPLGCMVAEVEELGRNPTSAEIRCRYGVGGPGRFGLSFLDLPVYQSTNPLPGTHLVGIRGFPAPAAGESFEQWEWRVLRAEFGAEVHRVHRGVELLHPAMMPRIVLLESYLRDEGIAFRRLESWRSAERQAFLFQLGRSRPGPFATATLTSFHNGVDAAGNPAGRAVDYGGGAVSSWRFHELVRRVGLASFGPDSHDPGHVYMPDVEVVGPDEVAVLRLLPRVPEVTLATGRPVDEEVGTHDLLAHRREARDFLERPFLRTPAPRLAGADRPLPWVAEVPPVPQAALPGRARSGLLSLRSAPPRGERHPAADAPEAEAR